MSDSLINKNHPFKNHALIAKNNAKRELISRAKLAQPLIDDPDFEEWLNKVHWYQLPCSAIIRHPGHPTGIRTFWCPKHPGEQWELFYKNYYFRITQIRAAKNKDDQEGQSFSGF